VQHQRILRGVDAVEHALQRRLVVLRLVKGDESVEDALLREALRLLRRP
jgi:hypothetical protein